jgi:hypothetical protein
MSHRIMAAIIPILATVTFCSQPALADNGGHATSSGYRLRMCESVDCRVPLASEPYEWLTDDGHVLNSGITDDRGYAAVSRAPGVTNYALENMNARWNMRVEDQCWSSDLEKCAQVLSTAQHDDFDDTQSSLAASGQSRKEKITQEQYTQPGLIDHLRDFMEPLGVILYTLFATRWILIWIITVGVICLFRLSVLTKVLISLALLIPFGAVSFVSFALSGRIG